MPTHTLISTRGSTLRLFVHDDGRRLGRWLMGWGGALMLAAGLLGLASWATLLLASRLLIAIAIGGAIGAMTGTGLWLIWRGALSIDTTQQVIALPGGRRLPFRDIQQVILVSSTTLQQTRRGRLPVRSHSIRLLTTDAPDDLQQRLGEAKPGAAVAALRDDLMAANVSLVTHRDLATAWATAAVLSAKLGAPMLDAASPRLAVHPPDAPTPLGQWLDRHGRPTHPGPPPAGLTVAEDDEALSVTWTHRPPLPPRVWLGGLCLGALLIPVAIDPALPLGGRAALVCGLVVAAAGVAARRKTRTLRVDVSGLVVGGPRSVAGLAQVDAQVVVLGGSVTRLRFGSEADAAWVRAAVARRL